MPLFNFQQPTVIEVNEALKLVKPERESWDLGLPWYQDQDVLYYSEGVTEKVYDMKVITSMYSYLSKIGELYFIEIFENGLWKTIGDVTLSEKTMPIVIGDKKYWGKGIGKKVISRLLLRAKDIGLKKICLSGIYHYNERSKNLFKSLGFTVVSEDGNKEVYEVVLRK